MQTNLVAVQDDLVKASDVKPQIVEVPPPPPPARTEREMQEELAKGLGIKVEAIKQFVEAQKGATKTSGVPVMADVRPSRPGRWRSRFTPGPIVQTPAYLINVRQADVKAEYRADRSYLAGLPNFSSPVRRAGPRLGRQSLPVHFHHLSHRNDRESALVSAQIPGALH